MQAMKGHIAQFHPDLHIKVLPSDGNIAFGASIVFKEKPHA